MKYFFNVLLVLISLGVFAQNKLSKVDSVMANEVDKAVDNILMGKPRTDEYLVFRYGYDFIYAGKNEAGYILYEGKIVFNVQTQKDEVVNIKIKEVSENKILKRCFSKQVCKPSFVFTASDPSVSKYINPDSRYIYFVINRYKNKICEFNVPITFSLKHRDKRSEIPLEGSVLRFLIYETVLDR